MIELYKETHCAQPEWFYMSPTQEICEIILRQAVKSCENYATDVIILLDEHSGELHDLVFTKQEGTLDIYYRMNGVDWENPLTEQWRYHHRIVKNGQEYTLFGEHGDI